MKRVSDSSRNSGSNMNNSNRQYTNMAKPFSKRSNIKHCIYSFFLWVNCVYVVVFFIFYIVFASRSFRTKGAFKVNISHNSTHNKIAITNKIEKNTVIFLILRFKTYIHCEWIGSSTKTKGKKTNKLRDKCGDAIIFSSWLWIFIGTWKRVDEILHCFIENTHSHSLTHIHNRKTYVLFNLDMGQR